MRDTRNSPIRKFLQEVEVSVFAEEFVGLAIAGLGHLDLIVEKADAVRLAPILDTCQRLIAWASTTTLQAIPLTLDYGFQFDANRM